MSVYVSWLIIGSAFVAVLIAACLLDGLVNRYWPRRWS